MRLLRADVVEPVGNNFVNIFPFAVEEAPLIHHTLWSAFTACTVVRQQHDHCVVRHSALFQKCKQSANLGISVIKHCGKGFLQPACKQLLVLRQIHPRAYTRVAHGKRCVLRNNSHFFLTCKHSVAMHVPTLIKLATPFRQVRIGCMMRCVLCTKCQVQIKWSVRSHRHQVTHPGC